MKLVTILSLACVSAYSSPLSLEAKVGSLVSGLPAHLLRLCGHQGRVPGPGGGDQGVRPPRPPRQHPRLQDPGARGRGLCNHLRMRRGPVQLGGGSGDPPPQRGAGPRCDTISACHSLTRSIFDIVLT